MNRRQRRWPIPAKTLARLGNWPARLVDLRIIEDQMTSRSGTALGKMFAAFHKSSRHSTEESEALAMGTGLTTPALETQRLYSDLMHRSEFDLLTDTQNRFSMEKQLDSLIDEARRTAGIFGIIYIDLDRFKQVNDVYGHQIGDLYRQQAVLRMKQQLRPSDILARLGGDEFGALVSVIRNRAHVEEIALRLERCFDEPFAIEGNSLQGSASIGIALYPEDASTKEALLRSADSAMYAAKNAKRYAPGTPAPSSETRP